VRWSPRSLFKWLAAPPSPQVNLASADASTAVGGHGEGQPWRGGSMGATEHVGFNAEVQRILGLISCNKAAQIIAESSASLQLSVSDMLTRCEPVAPPERGRGGKLPPMGGRPKIM